MMQNYDAEPLIIVNVRLTKVKEKLREGLLPVGDICSECVI